MCTNHPGKNVLTSPKTRNCPFGHGQRRCPKPSGQAFTHTHTHTHPNMQCPLGKTTFQKDNPNQLQNMFLESKTILDGKNNILKSWMLGGTCSHPNPPPPSPLNFNFFHFHSPNAGPLGPKWQLTRDHKYFYHLREQFQISRWPINVVREMSKIILVLDIETHFSIKF